MENFNIDSIIALLQSYGLRIIGAVVMLIVGWWIIGAITNSLNRFLAKRDIDSTLRPFLVSIIDALMKVMLVISVAGYVGIETTSFVAVLGAAGLAVGLALQGSLSNFAGGVLIIIFKPFKLGDYIVAQGQEGFVDEIQIFTTLLRTHDNRKIILPNGPLLNGVITNVTANGTLRVATAASIANIADLEKARQAMLTMAYHNPQILKTPAPEVVVSGLRDNGCDLTMTTWCNAGDAIGVGFAMSEGVKKALTEFNIEGPSQVRHIINH